MDRAGKLPSPRQSASDGAIFILLGLKLILLAFFILLATLSRFEEERSRAVMESVTTAFRGHVTALETMPRPDAGLGQLDGAPSLVEQVETLFKQSLPLVEMETSADGAVLRLEALANSLFSPASADLKPGRDTLMRRLAGALSKDEGPQRFREMRFLHSLGEGQALERDDLPVLRGGVVVRRLTQLGLESGTLSTGLWPVQPGDADVERIAFEIRLRMPMDAASPAAGGEPAP